MWPGVWRLWNKPRGMHSRAGAIAAPGSLLRRKCHSYPRSPSRNCRSSQRIHPETQVSGGVGSVAVRRPGQTCWSFLPPAQSSRLGLSDNFAEILLRVGDRPYDLLARAYSQIYRHKHCRRVTRIAGH